MSYVVYVDMDAFYVSCELRDRPDLAGRPVIVGRAPTGPDSRGVVLSASYEARKFGVRSALPVTFAARKCPEAVWIAPDFEKYGRVAEMIRAYLGRWSPHVVPLSIDEAAMEVEFDAPAEVEAWARDVQSGLKAELALPCSIGASPYAVVAKMACDAAKPGGIRVVPAAETTAFLGPLPVRAVPGIGPKSAERLTQAGIPSLDAVAQAPLDSLRRVLGRFGDAVQQLALGQPGPSLSALPVDRGPRQRSLDRTFERDTDDFEEIRQNLEEMAQELAGILSEEGLRYQQVVVRMRWEDFTQLQRGQLLPSATEGAAPLGTAAVHLGRELIERERGGRSRSVRRVSLSAGRLVPRRGQQASLEAFVDGAKAETHQPPT